MATIVVPETETDANARCNHDARRLGTRWRRRYEEKERQNADTWTSNEKPETRTPRGFHCWPMSGRRQNLLFSVERIPRVG